MGFELIRQMLARNNGFMPNSDEDSWYRTYKDVNLVYPTRISNHGTHLKTWLGRDFLPWKTNNICVVISENGKSDSNEIIRIQEQLPMFYVKQYVYDSKLLTNEDCKMIYDNIRQILQCGEYIDPLKETNKCAKYELLESKYDSPSTPSSNSKKQLEYHKHKPSHTFRKRKYGIPYAQYEDDLTDIIPSISIMVENKEYKTNKNMAMNKIRITENELKQIVSESVKKALKESYNDDMHMHNYKDAMSDRYEDLSVDSIVDDLKYEEGVDLGECPYIWEPSNWVDVLQYATEFGYNPEEVRECILKKLNLDIKMTQQSIEAVKNWRFQ